MTEILEIFVSELFLGIGLYYADKKHLDQKLISPIACKRKIVEVASWGGQLLGKSLPISGKWDMLGSR